MVLSNTKLKRKKREEAAAPLAPPPDSNATASSKDIPNGGPPVVVSAKKKKRRKSKTSVADGHFNGHAGEVLGMEVDIIHEKRIPSAELAVIVAEPTPQGEEVKSTKRQKTKSVATASCGEASVTVQEPEMDVPPASVDITPETFAAPSEGVSKCEGDGVPDVVDGVPAEGQLQEEPVKHWKVRQKPRWPLVNGKRIKPGTVVCESYSSPVPTSDGADAKSETKGTNDGEPAGVLDVVVQNACPIVKGDEPWLESKRKKKKEKYKEIVKANDEVAVGCGEASIQPAYEDLTRLEEKVHPKKVMVGGMPYYVTEDDIHEFFQECGTISELDCMIFPDTGKFRGIAFITFREEQMAAIQSHAVDTITADAFVLTEEAVKRALALDGADMGGRFLKIEVCKVRPKELVKKDAYREPPKKYDGCLSAYVGNLAWDISEKELRSFFQGSKIEAIRFAVDKETADFRGFGHIDFADDESLEAAMKLDQMEVLGRPIRIAYSVPKRTTRETSEVEAAAGEPKKKNCFTCGEGGHMSYNCPKKPLV